jgi:hypothetical protein
MHITYLVNFIRYFHVKYMKVTFIVRSKIFINRYAESLVKIVFKVIMLFLSYSCINRAINLLEEAIVIFRARIKTRKCVNANKLRL